MVEKETRYKIILQELLLTESEFEALKGETVDVLLSPELKINAEFEFMGTVVDGEEIFYEGE